MTEDPRLSQPQDLDQQVLPGPKTAVSGRQAPCAPIQKIPYEMYFDRKTRRALNRPRVARTVTLTLRAWSGVVVGRCRCWVVHAWGDHPPVSQGRRRQVTPTRSHGVGGNRTSMESVAQGGLAP